MIRLRQELDSLLSEDIRDSFYFSKDIKRGEGKLTINGKCGNIIVIFNDITFNKLTKKDIAFIKEMIEPRMGKINKQLEEYININNILEKSKNKLDEANIRVGWKEDNFINTKLGYTAYIDKDYKATEIEMNIKNINEAINIFDDVSKKISIVKEYLINKSNKNKLINNLSNNCNI